MADAAKLRGAGSPEAGLAADLDEEAAGMIGDLRRAVEMSKVWWTDDDRYRAPWNHREDCACQACYARDLARGVLARLEGGSGDE